MTRCCILIPVLGLILASGCRRQPEHTPDAHFSGIGDDLMPVTLEDTPSKDLLQSAASTAVAEAPAAAPAPEAEPVANADEPGEEKDAEETAEVPPNPAPAKPNRPNRREYDPNDPVNQTIGTTPGLLNRG